MEHGLWGPADPWSNGDFLGARWLFWAASQAGDPTNLLNHPWGEASIISSFPNPFDAWLLGPLVAQMSFPLWFNLMMLGHHLLNVMATVVLARSAGARPLHAAAAGALVAATPLMLHEHTLGHTLTAAVWPGLFGLAALLRGRDIRAGVWIAVQGFAYLYSGLAIGLVALCLRPRRGLWLAILLVLPYLYILAPGLEPATATAPPDGFTALPLDGLFWGAQQSQVRLHPLLLLGLAVPFFGAQSHQTLRRRLGLTAALLLLVSLGPAWVLHRGQEPLFGSPVQYLLGLPGLSRMHHPIRMGMLATPLLAVGLALALHRKRAIWALLLMISTVPTWKTIDNTVAWPSEPHPPGAHAAEWLAEHASGVVDLGSHSMEALALQTIHGKPILAGFHPRTHPRSGLDPTVFQAVEDWSHGKTQPNLPNTLKHLGYSHVLVIDRGRPLDASAVEAQLGSPVAPGIFALY
jgi:hypothetical protein